MKTAKGDFVIRVSAVNAALKNLIFDLDKVHQALLAAGQADE